MLERHGLQRRKREPVDSTRAVLEHRELVLSGRVAFVLREPVLIRERRARGDGDGKCGADGMGARNP